MFIEVFFSHSFSFSVWPNAVYWPPHSSVFQITHNDALQSVRLLWTSDQLVAGTFTWQHTIFTTDKIPFFPRDSISNLSRGTTAELRLWLHQLMFWNNI